MITKQKSIKKNFMYSSVLKVLNIIFPLITFPYVARILSPTGIGKIDFSLSIVQYFVLIAQVGIPTYAIRECSRVRDDKAKLTQTVQEILLINFFTMIFSYIIFFTTVFNVETLSSYKTLLIITSINILSTSIGVEWFYQSIEEYKYITIRSLLVKLVSLFLIFAFIRHENDFIIYGAIVVLSNSLGYVYNFFHIQEHIKIFTKQDNYNFKRHIKPVIILFAMSISVSVYINLDKVMLGLICGDSSVGLYSAANKLVKIILTLVTSLGVVLFPRMSYYIESNEVLQVQKLISNALNFIIMISLPATVGIIMLATPTIQIFAGYEYIEAITTIRIISPIIIAIALSNLIGIQILVSHGKEKITLVSTILGAVINLSLNLILIPILKQNGAAIGTLVAETSVMTFQLFYAYSYIKGNIKLKNIASYFFGSSLIIIVILTLNLLVSNMIIFTSLSVILSVVVYFGFLYFIRNELVYEMSKKALMKLKRKSKN